MPWDLEITRATLADKGWKLSPILNAEKQTLTLKLPAKLAPGRYELALEFKGKLGAQAQGLFYVKYPAASGTKLLLATQMEPADARRMFPCWDEPVFRATFELTAVVPANHRAYSNMPVEHEKEISGGLKEVKFARTPPMPSYLVALVSGELEELEDQVGGVRIHVVTTAGKREQGRYALESTKELLAYYNDYFGIKYPLPKLDQLALPGGFSGAMENWGAITYNESVLLFDSKTSSQQTRQDIFVTVAHELSHQWFGDLVTPAWWDNLWLNEGFASWMEIKATDHFNPDWQMWLTAAAEKTVVMTADARSTTHPIQMPVANESEANDAFDSITYQKGRAFLRMLESYLGEPEFRRGIHEYLAEHAPIRTRPRRTLWAGAGKSLGQADPENLLRLDRTAGAAAGEGEGRLRVNGKQTDKSMQQERMTVRDPEGGSREQWRIPIALLDCPPAAGPRSAPVPGR